MATSDDTDGATAKTKPQTLPLVTDPQGNPIATSPVGTSAGWGAPRGPDTNPYANVPGMGVPADAGGAATSHNPWGASPNSYNVNANLASSEGLAQQVYGQAYKSLQGMGQAPSANINAQTIAAPNTIQAQNVNAPDAIQAQQVQASGLVQGQQADALRSQQLEQAAVAANSPSAAAAQMKAAGAQIQNQQLGQAAMARGPDRAAAKRTAMLGTGTQGMQAAQSSAAMAAQELAAKQQAYSQALSGVRSGDVSGAQTQQEMALANQQAGLQAQTTTGQQSLAAQTANQQAGLTAQTATGQQYLTAAQANQGANLTAQQAQIQNQQAAWNAQQQAQNAYLGTELQGVGAQNQAQAVASGYGQTQNALNQQKSSDWLTTMFGLSDERAKRDVAPLPNIYGGQPYQSKAPNFLAADYQAKPLGPNAGSAGIGQNILGMAKGLVSGVLGDKANAAISGTGTGAATGAGGTAAVDAGGEDVAGSAAATDAGAGAAADAGGEELLSAASGENCKTEITPVGGGQSYSGLLKNAYGLNDDAGSPYSSQIGHQNMLDWNWNPLNRTPASSSTATAGQSSTASFTPMGGGMGQQGGLQGGLMPSMSDQRAKEEAQTMVPEEVAAWSEDVPTAVFRYKPGIPGTDGGVDYHAGTLAQGLERTGPLGRLMVHERPDGLKEVEYGPLGLMVGKGALTKADQALQVAQAAYALAAKKGSRHGRH